MYIETQGSPKLGDGDSPVVIVLASQANIGGSIPGYASMFLGDPLLIQLLLVNSVEHKQFHLYPPDQVNDRFAMENWTKSNSEGIEMPGFEQ